MSRFGVGAFAGGWLADCFPAFLRAKSRRMSVEIVCGAVLAGVAVLCLPTQSVAATLQPLTSAASVRSLDEIRAHQAHFGFARAGCATLHRTALGDRQWYNHFDSASHRRMASRATFQSDFDRAAGKADLSREKLAALFKQGAARASLATVLPQGNAADALAARMAPNEARSSSVLAYASASPAPEGSGLAAISALAPLEEDVPEGVDTETVTGLPEVVQVPLRRPGELVERQIEEEPTDKAAERSKPQRLAFARPENPVEQPSRGSFGSRLRGLFGGARAGNGVAVYDISAAKVYMPDGSVLEAHSGIGKMADNPRYVHVKMTGPTPPHTYNLRMREKRFHGVEAIRMLPVDGKNKYGRDGFLTHSYLLRGGRAESHGCVAFKDYRKFLTAFKQGKVRQIVVVSGGGSSAKVLVARK